MARAGSKHKERFRNGATANVNETKTNVPSLPATASRVTPVLLAGGGGSRLWPLSCKARPKQLLRLLGSHTLLQDTALKFVDPKLFGPVTVVANLQQSRSPSMQQFQELGLASPSTVMEPVGRGTAAPAAIAALLAMERDPDGLLLLCPSDHAISDTPALHAAIRDGTPLARDGHFVLFGVPPTGPSTGYGYIRPGRVFVRNSRVREITAFFEKPDVRTAEAYVRSGMLWNSGMFLARATTLLTEIARHAPDIVEDCQDALSSATIEGGCVTLNAEALQQVSLDFP